MDTENKTESVENIVPEDPIEKIPEEQPTVDVVEVSHSKDYILMKNAMTHSNFLKKVASDRINYLADTMKITQDEATELMDLCNSKGYDILPTDAYGRLTAVENNVDDIILLIADLIGGVTA